MPVFSYKAAYANGDITEGRLEASSPQAVAQHLQAAGQVPISVREYVAREAPARPRLRLNLQRESLHHRDIELFTLQLSTLLRAGLSLGQALETIARLTDKRAVRELGHSLNQAVRRGETLSDALRQAHPLFDRFYRNMVKAGESAGALDLALESLAGFKAKARETRESLISALIYPAILLILSLAAVAVMLAFVVPQFTELFDEAGQAMPLLTRIVAAAGELITRWWWLMLTLTVGMVLLLRRRWSEPHGREQRDRWLLRLPLLGTLLLKIETARFTRTLATLLGNGVSLLTAMQIAKETVGNRIVAGALETSAIRVRRGEGLGRPLSDCQVFPSLAVQLIHIGEHSGHLEPMLEQVAEIYEQEVDSGLKRLLGLVEPSIIILIALFITLIILSIVMLILASNNLVF